MEAARPNLRLVDPETGEIRSPDEHAEALEQQVRELQHQVRDLEDLREGNRKTIEKQSREIGVLTRKVREEADPTHHPQGAEIVELIERWMQAAGHPKAKVSDDRVKTIKARIREGYEITSEDPLPTHPTLELAVDGIAAFPFVVNGTRVRNGEPSHRHDRLGIALGGGEKVEEFSRLGYQARKAGWTPEEGWQ